MDPTQLLDEQQHQIGTPRGCPGAECQLQVERAEERRGILEALRQCVLERNYINNLLATIEREASGLQPRGTSREAFLSPKP